MPYYYGYGYGYGGYGDFLANNIYCLLLIPILERFAKTKAERAELKR